MNNIHIKCPECNAKFVRIKCYIKHLMSGHTLDFDDTKDALKKALSESIMLMQQGKDNQMSDEDVSAMIGKCVSTFLQVA